MPNTTIFKLSLHFLTFKSQYNIIWLKCHLLFTLIFLVAILNILDTSIIYTTRSCLGVLVDDSRWNYPTRVVAVSGGVQGPAGYGGGPNGLLVKETRFFTTPRPKTSDILNSEQVNCALYCFMSFWTYSRQKFM